MRKLTQDNHNQTVLAGLADTPDAPLREAMTELRQSLVTV